MRWFNKIYAKLFGYFWLPCPRCDRMFGGHEAGNDVLWDTPKEKSGKICCSKCCSKCQGYLMDADILKAISVCTGGESECAFWNHRLGVCEKPCSTACPKGVRQPQSEVMETDYSILGQEKEMRTVALILMLFSMFALCMSVYYLFKTYLILRKLKLKKRYSQEMP